MKKVMILMAERTGTGHKSAANAIEKNLKKLGYDTLQIDSFTMMGKFGEELENSYIPITTKQPLLFYAGYKVSQDFSNLIHSMIYHNCRRKLLKHIREYKPDLIISVHAMFTKAVSRLLEKEKINIPFYVDVIDLVDPPEMWVDKNADVIFLPDEIIKNDYINRGFDKDKLVVSGFPIRNDIERRKTPKKINGKINILLVNPSVQLSKNYRYLKEISKLDNVTINFICGRDERLYKYLIKKQDSGQISKDVHIHSFVKNMNEFLDNAHILLTKAGPNMILEGARSATAIVVTGHIKGQENNNYKYVTKNKFGFKCEDPKKIYEKLNDFINSHKLEECLKNVINADCNNGAEIIANYINDSI